MSAVCGACLFPTAACLCDGRQHVKAVAGGCAGAVAEAPPGGADRGWYLAKLIHSRRHEFYATLSRSPDGLSGSAGIDGPTGELFRVSFCVPRFGAGTPLSKVGPPRSNLGRVSTFLRGRQ